MENSQANNLESLNRVLKAAAIQQGRRVEDASASAVVMGREDEGREPEVRKDQVEWQHVAPVRLDHGQEHSKEVHEKGDDSLPWVRIL